MFYLFFVFWNGLREYSFTTEAEEMRERRGREEKSFFFCCWKSNCSRLLKGQAKHTEAVCRGSDTHTHKH